MVAGVLGTAGVQREVIAKDLGVVLKVFRTLPLPYGYIHIRTRHSNSKNFLEGSALAVPCEAKMDELRSDFGLDRVNLLRLARLAKRIADNDTTVTGPLRR